MECQASGRLWLSYYLSIHTLRVATLVTLRLGLGLMMVSSIRAGFLLTVAQKAVEQSEPHRLVAAIGGRHFGVYSSRHLD